MWMKQTIPAYNPFAGGNSQYLQGINASGVLRGEQYIPLYEHINSGGQQSLAPLVVAAQEGGPTEDNSNGHQNNKGEAPSTSI